MTIAAAAVLAVAATAVVLIAPPSQGFPAGSSNSSGPDGAAAAFRALASLEYRVGQSSDPIPAIAAPPRSTLLVLAEPIEAPSDQDRRALRAFIAAGGAVIATGCTGAMFLGATSSHAPTERTGVSTYRAVVRSPLTVDASEITMADVCKARLAPGFVPLYVGTRNPGVEVQHVGEGVALWFASVAPLTNLRISDAGNFDLLLNVAGAPRRTVLWDEYYHGQRRSIWSYTTGTPLGWAMAQAGLVLAVAGATYARRRAPIRARVVESRTSPLEFVDTMASLYARAGSARDAVALAYARARRLLLASTGQEANASHTALASAAALRARMPADEIASLLDAGQAASSDVPLTPDAALDLVQRLQRLAAAVQTGG